MAELFTQQLNNTAYCLFVPAISSRLVVTKLLFIILAPMGFRSANEKVLQNLSQDLLPKLFIDASLL